MKKHIINKIDNIALVLIILAIATMIYGIINALI